MSTPEAGKKAPYRIPIGPVHPALKEPVLFTFEIEGEVVKKVDFAPGNTHRGVEWMGMRRNPVQIVHLTDRICGICGIVHSLSFAQAVEQIAGIEVPPRAEYIRTILHELERIQSHLLWAGVAAHELGFDSLFYLSWRVRERSMDLIEEITGNRVNYGIIQIGGVRRNITEDQYPKVLEGLKYYSDLFGKMADLFLNDVTIAMRCQGHGLLTEKDARELCAVGPTARASGVTMDVRHDHPYCAYGDLDVTPILPQKPHGDIYDRVIVRLLEIKQSIGIIESCIDQMPQGEVLWENKLPKVLATCKKAQGEAIGRVEAPRGECMHYVRMDGNEAPATWKVKASSYSNLMSWIPMLLGEQIADIPIIVASIDPCMSCTDRVTLIREGRADTLSGESLTRMSREKTRRLQK
ncbi:MAG: nickel-dependent hydrogenase large subunit [Methanomicrobiales archaeon]|jgi:membrane-bound hydrogenase subunit alpha|nr:nickel-dependent hydrogenase large subunit [Methanomicrobiales archaeon]